MEAIYDIAVIGAGPAGATFARQVASPNRRVLLIDAQEKEHSKPCGGLLAPDAQKVLAHFDLVLPKSVLADPQIFSVKTIDLPKRQVRYYQRYYLNMDRYAFDRYLLSLVPDSVEIVSGRCCKVQRREGRFFLQVETHSGEMLYECRQLVGADGAHSLVRKSFFQQEIMQYVAIQQWFRNGGESTPFYSCIFDPETSESCSWLMHKNSHVIYGGCFLPQNCRAAFEAQKRRLVAFLGEELGDLEKTEACLVNRPKKLSDFVTGKDGVYLIGEAAGFISASSFEGISSAIVSGNLLAISFLESSEPSQIAKRYRRLTSNLRLKLFLKMRKRWFMYTPWVRSLIMKSGIDSIDVQVTKE